jgi:dTMP kinase
MLVTITGIDGCGKGTQLQHLAAFLQGQGRSVFVSKAYGDAEKELFALFIERATDEAVMFLFQAMHAEQRAKAARAQERGEIVLADRWDESYEAYHSQYGVLSHDTELRQRLNEVAFRGWRADTTILLRVPVAMAIYLCLILDHCQVEAKYSLAIQTVERKHLMPTKGGHGRKATILTAVVI